MILKFEGSNPAATGFVEPITVDLGVHTQNSIFRAIGFFSEQLTKSPVEY